MSDEIQQAIWNGDSIEYVQYLYDSSVNCVITDPPFGTSNLSNQAVTPTGKKYARKIANDENFETASQITFSVFERLMPKIVDQADIYIFTSYQVLADWMKLSGEFFADFGFKQKALIVWEKDGPGMGDTNCPWGMGMEFILFFQRNPREKTAQRRNAVIRTPQIRPNQLLHPHQKPGPLLETFIKTSTVKGDLVVDPFGGSGSLALAARNTERNCVCIELDEHNYELAVKNFEATSATLL